MLRKEALYQSLASCGTVLIAFIGVCHEFVGHIVFPWAPALFGGPIGWHGLGLFVITVGLLLLGGTLRVISFPVAPWALAVSGFGLVVGIFTAVVHHQFHMFAFTNCGAGVVAALFHRKALLLSAASVAVPAQQGTPADATARP